MLWLYMLFYVFPRQLSSFLLAEGSVSSCQIFRLCRSHSQLQKLGEQLDVDVIGPSNEDGSKINTTVDDETVGNFSSPLHESQLNSPRKKKSRSGLENHDSSNRGSLDNHFCTETYTYLTHSSVVIEELRCYKHTSN